jgi:hypothetical protein
MLDFGDAHLRRAAGSHATFSLGNMRLLYAYIGSSPRRGTDGKNRMLRNCNGLD